MRRNPLLIATAASLLLHGYIAARLLPALALPPHGLALALLQLLASAVVTPATPPIRLSHLSARASDVRAWCGYRRKGTFSGLLVLNLVPHAARRVLLNPAWGRAGRRWRGRK